MASTEHWALRLLRKKAAEMIDLCTCMLPDLWWVPAAGTWLWQCSDRKQGDSQPADCWEVMLSEVTPVAIWSAATDGMAQGTVLDRLLCALLKLQVNYKILNCNEFSKLPGISVLFLMKTWLWLWLGGEVKSKSIAMAAVTEMKMIHLVLVS